MLIEQKEQKQRTIENYQLVEDVLKNHRSNVLSTL
jgi:hypothetical protein